MRNLMRGGAMVLLTAGWILPRMCEYFGRNTSRQRRKS